VSGSTNYLVYLVYLQTELFEKDAVINSLKLKVSHLNKENEDKKSEIERQGGQIEDLEVSNKKVKEIADKV
jgi:cell division protein FtsL